jgi:hypothetical protein
MGLFHEFAEMRVGPRAFRALAELQDKFSSDFRIEMKLLARPVGHNPDGGRGGKFMVLGFAVKIDVNGDAPTAMAMDVVMVLDFEHLDSQADVDRLVLIGAVLDVVRLVQSFLALTDEDKEIPAARHEFRPDQDVPEDLAGRRHDHFRLGGLAVNKQFQFIVLHKSPFPRATKGLHRQRRRVIVFVCMDNGLTEPGTWRHRLHHEIRN